MGSNQSLADVVRQLEAEQVGKVKLAITDIDGVLRGKVISWDKFRSIAEKGFGFCDVVFGWDAEDRAYDNGMFTGWHTGYPDALAVVDVGTFRRVPWEGGMPFFLADFRAEAADICPRGLLKRVIGQAAEAGYTAYFSQEFEWFNYRAAADDPARRSFGDLEPMTKGMFGYSIVRASQGSAYFHDLFDSLQKWGVPLEGLHTETGPGVYEAAITYANILEAADRAVLFKTGVKEIAHKHGILPTFMAKVSETLPGCSGHVHQSLWKEGVNLFHDAGGEQGVGSSGSRGGGSGGSRDVGSGGSRDVASSGGARDGSRGGMRGMSPLMESYMAGQLHCLPHILPMIAPTVNSYKRLVEGAWAPTTLTWGIDNRTVALRALPGGSSSTRLETRVVGADANPYLAMAACLAAGLYGIRQKLSLGAETKGNGYADRSHGVLPRNLWEATQAMKGSPLAVELFGEAFTDHFIRTREWEWRQYSQVVTDWELKRYLEII